MAGISLASLSPDQGFVILGAQAGELAGIAVTAAGDVNDDGFGDLLVSVIGAVDGISMVHVVLGRAGGLAGPVALGTLGPDQVLTITGDSPGSLAGWSAAAAGDVNGDGIGDLVVGAAYSDNETGAAFVVFGQAGESPGPVALDALPPDRGFAILGAEAGDLAGMSVALVGDVNGDGFDDLLIGAPGENNSIGAAYVVFGRAGGLLAGPVTLGALAPDQGFVIVGGAENDGAGWSVAAAGDLNGDGLGDLVVGMVPGLVHVVFGRAGGIADPVALGNLAPNQGFTIAGSLYAYPGARTVAGVGDVNGDGFDDLLVGAPGSVDGNGAAFVVFGRPGGPGGPIALGNLTPDQGFAILGAHPYVGWSVAAAGDVNGDGFGDMLVGAPLDHDRAGAAYVVFGGADGPPGPIALGDLGPDQGFAISGGPDYSYFGWSVAAAGDENLDGFDDLLIGAPGADDFAGAAYVIRGFGDPRPVTWSGTPKPEAMSGTAREDTLHGEGGDDRLGGRGGADRLGGGDGQDTLLGGLGDDHLEGGAGDDSLDGGAGIDHVLLQGARGEYAISQGAAPGTIRVADLVAGRDGVDELVGVEALVFVNPTVWRFYNIETGGHFYTASAAERDHVLSAFPQFQAEGFGPPALSNPDAAGQAPVYRFFNAVTQVHFFTASAAERDYVLNTFPQFQFEGVAFHAQAEGGPGYAPVFRFYNERTQAHFYTGSEAERDGILANLPDWRAEGIAYHAPTVMADLMMLA